MPFDDGAWATAEWRCTHRVGANVFFDPVVTVRWREVSSPPLSFTSDAAGGVCTVPGEWQEFARGFARNDRHATAWLSQLCEALWETTSPPPELVAAYA